MLEEGKMNAKITLVELAQLMADVSSTSKRVCELFLRELFATVSQSLIDGEQVKIEGVGTFKVTEVKSRKSGKLSTGNAMEIGGHKRITFTPAKSLAEAVNQPFAQFESVYLDDAVTDEQLAEIDRQNPSLTEPPIDSEEDVAAPALPIEERGTQQDDESDRPDAMVEEQVALSGEPQVEEITEERVGDQEEMPGQPDVSPQSRPMLVGIPIDGPSQPVPEPEPVFEPDPNEYFYRPEPRNSYTPTPEQLAAVPHHSKRWMWILIAVAAAGLLLWLLTRGGGMAGEAPDEAVVELADTVVEPDVVTDTVTARIVLTTLSERYYDSPWFWVYIYEENKSIISNPNNIKPGTVVVIPPADKYGIDANDPASLKKAQRRSWELLKGK